jgi:6-phosphogluconolactonase
LPFFDSLAEQKLQWGRIDVSLVDERAVQVDHADSNSALVARHLLQGAAQAARWLPVVTPDSVAMNSDAWELAQACVHQANQNPELAAPAAVVLGMGADGHTASLFADASQWSNACATQARYVAVVPGKAPHPRISLSLSALINQRVCYLWSGGADKLEVLNRAKILADDVAHGRVNADALFEAGPLALLIAQSKVTLHVFHYDH